MNRTGKSEQKKQGGNIGEARHKETYSPLVQNLKFPHGQTRVLYWIPHARLTTDFHCIACDVLCFSCICCITSRYKTPSPRVGVFADCLWCGASLSPFYTASPPVQLSILVRRQGMLVWFLIHLQRYITAERWPTGTKLVLTSSSSMVFPACKLNSNALLWEPACTNNVQSPCERILVDGGGGTYLCGGGTVNVISLYLLDCANSTGWVVYQRCVRFEHILPRYCHSFEKRKNGLRFFFILLQTMRLFSLPR